MRLHVLQHVPFEDEAEIGAWAAARGWTVTRSRLFADEDPHPAPGGVDGLVIMGGPMGVYDYESCPWLLREKTYILDTIRANRHVLGICLGAQLIADVLGAPVRKNPHPEIGWFPVRLSGVLPDAAALSALPAVFHAFHWHNDSFEIPRGAVRFAGSDACRNQGFFLGQRVAGLQFHLEYSARSIEAMLENAHGELEPGPFVQSRETILAGLGRTVALRNLLFDFLDRFLVQ